MKRTIYLSSRPLIGAAIQPKAMTDGEQRELERLVGQISGFVKMMMGVADNVAITVMRHANDQIIDRRSDDDYKVKPRQAHPGYRQQAKRSMREAMDEVVRWRTRLLYPSQGELRFFCVADMPEEARRKYGAMTDQEYFEFWTATGAGAYQRSLPLVRSLWWKFAKSMEQHGVRASEQTAWGLTALTVLQLAVETFDRSMRSVNEAMEGRLSADFMERIYRPFSLRRVCDLWQQGLIALSPETATYKLTSAEERNIELGVEQLRELWISPTTPFESLAGAVNDYDELFASKSVRRSVLSDINQMRLEAEKDVQRLKEENMKEKVLSKHE